MNTALKALADPRRRKIVQMIWTTELPASSIAERFDDATRPAISQHLGVLRSSGLITERRDGTKRLYRANHGEMAKLRNFIDDYWSESLARLRDHSEAAEATSSGAKAQANGRMKQKRAPTDGWIDLGRVIEARSETITPSNITVDKRLGASR